LQGKASYYASEDAKNPLQILHDFLRQSLVNVAQLSHCKFNLIPIDTANGSAEITSHQGKFR
jgi:hypothetical protein